MRVLHVDPAHPDPGAIEEAAAMIRAGDVVAFPTETVYGLGANALDAEAVARIYAAKGRPAWNPVIVHVASAVDARALVSHWPESATTVADALWPGPLTIVLPKASQVPDIVTAGLGNVALRVPSHPVALALIRAAGRPIAAPSANRFSAVSPTTAAHVAQSLDGRIGLVLDGGPADVGIESTVLDLSGETPVILRPGMISRDWLEGLLGVEVDYRGDVSPAADLAGAGGSPAAQPSPGRAHRHYAPRAEVWLFETEDAESVRDALSSRLQADTMAAQSVRSLLIHLGDDALPEAVGRRRMPAVPEPYARQLYQELHDADDAGVSLLVIELPPRHDVWTAIHDRLTRASR